MKIQDMEWLNLVQNPEPIKNIYSNTPLLTGVRIKSLELRQDGPLLIMRIDLPEYPSNPPIKWEKEGFDTVSLDLEFIEISDLRIENWLKDNVTDIIIKGTKDALSVETENGNVIVTFTASSLFIMKTSAYKNGEN